MIIAPKEDEIDPTQFSEEENLIYEKIRKQQLLDGQISDEGEGSKDISNKQETQSKTTTKLTFSAKKKLEEMKIGQIFKKDKQKQQKQKQDQESESQQAAINLENDIEQLDQDEIVVENDDYNGSSSGGVIREKQAATGQQPTDDLDEEEAEYYDEEDEA